MTRQQVLDLYFLDARHKLVELAAFLDRIERAGGRDDFRLKSFRAALGELSGGKPQKARRVLLAFSDPTTKPVAAAETKGACGASRILRASLSRGSATKAEAARRRVKPRVSR